MNTIFPMNSPWAQALAWTLVHFIWQGAAIGLAAFVVLRVARLAAASRYVVGVAALAVMLAAPVLTFVILKQCPDPAMQIVDVPRISGHPDGRASASMDTRLPSSMESPASFAPWRPTPSLIIGVWLVGVAALSGRLLGGWLLAQRLITRAVQPVAPEICALARRLASRLPLDRVVRIFESSAVTVPVTIGWLKPVVLLPVSAMTGLSMAQIEALVAHELAHVRRHDYLVNLLQSAVETLLFYHPAVWWASRLVRTEREHCCDDMAVYLCDRLAYVTALSELAAIGTAPSVVMAASGGSLLPRVRRILGGTSVADRAGAAWLPVFALILFAGALVPAALTSAPAAIQDPRPAGVQSGKAGGVIGGEPGGVGGGITGGKTEGIAGGVAGEFLAGIKSGVSRGAVGGESSGVVGGIAEERTKAIEDGIAGGTPAGVKGGIPWGAEGGIVSAPRRSSQSTGSASQSGQRQEAEALRAEFEQEKEKQLRLVKVQVDEIERQRQELEGADKAAKREAEIAKLEIELKLARGQYERTKRLVEVGLATPQSLTEVEVGLRLVEQKIVTAQQGGDLQELNEKIADLTAQLALARLRLEKTMRLSAARLVVASAVKDAVDEVTAIELKLATAGKQLQLQEMEIELHLRQAERQAVMAEIEKALRAIGTQKKK